MTVFVKIFIGQVMNLLGFKNFQSVVGTFSDFPKYLRKDSMIKDGAKEQSQANKKSWKCVFSDNKINFEQFCESLCKR